MKKIFGIIALAALVACNKSGMEVSPLEQPSEINDERIAIIATLAPKAAISKAVADNDDNKITVTWAENEHIAILYQVDATNYAADATITAVDGTTGVATISFTVVDGTADNTPCTLVYPYAAAKDDHTGVKDAATLLGAQDGTLNANLDVRVGAGTIQTSTPSLNVTTQPAAQFAIFKFTVKNIDKTVSISVKPLTITIGTQDYVITPATATDVLYAALPIVSGVKIGFDATDNSNKTYTTCANIFNPLEAGYYYKTTLPMREYVDLGNGLKWATCNMGATNPEDYGYYFPWGMTYASSYDWATYAMCNGSNTTLTEYNTKSEYGTVDNKTVLELAADTARGNWGGTWRMPTKAEIDWLVNTSYCTWEKTTLNEVNGYRVTSKLTGYTDKSIFLPAAGINNGGSLVDGGTIGYYWSSSLNTDYPDKAHYLHLPESLEVEAASIDRCYGLPIRPVSE